MPSPNRSKPLHQRFQKPILILVDALDEAVQHKGSETIVDLLANASELPAQVRFVLTSRPEGAVLRHFEERKVPHFLLDAGRPENLKDIGVYIQKQIDTLEPLQTRLEEQKMSHDAFIERVTVASQGNFLYIVWLLPAIAAGRSCSTHLRLYLRVSMGSTGSFFVPNSR